MPALSRPRFGAARLGACHGIWVAATTFVPTFLAVVWGISYLTSLPMASRPVDLQGSAPPTMSSREPESGFGGVPSNEMAPERRAVWPVVGVADAPVRLVSTPTRESLGNTAVSATPAPIPRPAARPVPPSIELKPAEPQRSGPTVTRDDTWARGPAFASQDAAEHFAARMKRVGFPADVRREDRRGTRWVVWIGNLEE